ncbi:MAG: radical SAM protein [Desulfovibrionaceae bacterium]|nr:radical SAM protein [Desulfovibrionaceae bacterium]
MNPSYLDLGREGLKARARAAVQGLESCAMCPRACGADRLADERGFCGIGRRAVVASYNLHFGEEAPLVGQGGSGTIFFAGCNLGCVFCQNYEISHDPEAGAQAGPEELAGVMLELQSRGAENINLVTPSHVAAQVLEALVLAADNGLRLPLVYNTSAYDGLKTLRLMDRVADIYMPDAKMWDPKAAETYLGAANYPEAARTAIREMHRQVGDLVLDGRGVAVTGLLVRHLVMPGGLAGTGQWMEFLATEISRNSYLNIMDQYRPCGLAREHPAIDRSITPAEYAAALDQARARGLARLDDRSERLVFRLWKNLH